MEAVQLAPGVHIAPADVDAVIAGIGEHLSQGIALVPLVARIPHQTAGIAALPAVQTPPRAGGGRNLRVSVREVRAMIDKRVHVRGLDHGMAGDAYMIAAVLVGSEKQDVGALLIHADLSWNMG